MKILGRGFSSIQIVFLSLFAEMGFPLHALATVRQCSEITSRRVKFITTQEIALWRPVKFWWAQTKFNLSPTVRAMLAEAVNSAPTLKPAQFSVEELAGILRFVQDKIKFDQKMVDFPPPLFSQVLRGGRGGCEHLVSLTSAILQLLSIPHRIVGLHPEGEEGHLWIETMGQVVFVMDPNNGVYVKPISRVQELAKDDADSVEAVWYLNPRRVPYEQPIIVRSSSDNGTIVRAPR
ncbi:MAG: hypothetical protein C5B49_03015 [Bdellovibrio sp.]|nr:MAG: hypothetical protein C5B49_03015 [Bdellovibrio sp.]